MIVLFEHILSIEILCYLEKVSNFDQQKKKKEQLSKEYSSTLVQLSEDDTDEEG